MRFDSRRFLIFLFATIFSIIPCYDCRLLPTSIETCRRRDPQLTKCLTKETNRIVKAFTKGYPELGIVSSDPLELGDFQAFPKGNILQLSQENGILKGLKNAKVHKLDLNIENKSGYLHMVANLSLEAKYEVSGRLLLFPITGKGKSIIEQKNLELKLKFNWNTSIGKDGIEHMRITDYTFDVNREDSKFMLTGLFDGNKALGDTILEVINANGNSLMEEMGKPAMGTIIQRVMRVINKFFSKIPYDELLPDV